MSKKGIRNLLWKILGISFQHIQYVVDSHFLKEDKYTIIGQSTYDNNALVYRWSDAPLRIGKYCSIASGVKFLVDGGNHQIDGITSFPFRSVISNIKTDRKTGITIGNDVWIGVDAIILNGVAIGNGVTIAAGSIVTKDVPDYCIVAGAPAKIIKEKCPEEQRNAMNRIQWWNWDKETIAEREEDFMLSFSDFIEKYG